MAMRKKAISIILSAAMAFTAIPATASAEDLSAGWKIEYGDTASEEHFCSTWKEVAESISGQSGIITATAIGDPTISESDIGHDIADDIGLVVEIPVESTVTIDINEKEMKIPKNAGFFIHGKVVVESGIVDADEMLDHSGDQMGPDTIPQQYLNLWFGWLSKLTIMDGAAVKMDKVLVDEEDNKENVSPNKWDAQKTYYTYEYHDDGSKTPLPPFSPLDSCADGAKIIDGDIEWTYDGEEAVWKKDSTTCVGEPSIVSTSVPGGVVIEIGPGASETPDNVAYTIASYREAFDDITEAFSRTWPGGTVKMLKDIHKQDGAIKVPAKALRLDLNGKTIRNDVAGTGADGSAIWFDGSSSNTKGYDEFFIKDTSTEGDGQIVNGYEGEDGGDGINSRTLAVSSGKVKLIGGKISSNDTGVEVYDKGNFVMSGGIISDTHMKYGVALNGSEAEFHMLSGDAGPVPEIDVADIALMGRYQQAGEGTNIIIEEGILKAGGAQDGSSVALYHPQNGDVEISGGIFEGDVALSVRNGKFDISDGVFKGTGTFASDSDVPGDTGAAVSIVSDGENADAGIDMCISGGTFESVNGNAMYEGIARNRSLKSCVQSLDISGGTFVNGTDKSQINITACNTSLISGTFDDKITVPYIWGQNGLPDEIKLVTIDPNGGTYTLGKEGIVADGILDLPVATKTGVDFDGWKRVKGEEEESKHDAGTYDLNQETEDIAFIAQWKDKDGSGEGSEEPSEPTEPSKPFVPVTPSYPPNPVKPDEIDKVEQATEDIPELDEIRFDPDDEESIEDAREAYEDAIAEDPGNKEKLEDELEKIEAAEEAYTEAKKEVFIEIIIVLTDEKTQGAGENVPPEKPGDTEEPEKPEIFVTKEKEPDIQGLEKFEEGKDYEVIYENNEKVGKATAIVKGMGDLDGIQLKAEFIIKPQKAKVGKLKSQDRSITVTPVNQKKTGITGYHIAYKTSKGKWKYKMIKSSTGKVKLRGLKRGTKYTIKVRGIVKVDGTRYFGEWSKNKTVKTKKR